VAAVRIENRAQLIYLLTEAAELEHSVLCCYLFAKFSMKRDASEGLTTSQEAALKSWRGTIGHVVVQEMLHLASACNLLTAVGGSPQLRRPNLPTSARAYPPAFKLALVPFGLEALDQFIFLERPESMDASVHPATSYQHSALPTGSLSDIFTRERNYRTLGELYRGIEDGLKYLTHKLGEEKLFVGRPGSQTADAYHLQGLTPVHDLDSALSALGVIIEQGEGASPAEENSHYRRFVRVRNECRELMAADVSFRPGRPVVTNPYATLPTDLSTSSHISRIDDPISADLCNLFDGCYELLVQMLARVFIHAEESEAELAILADITVGMMIDVVEALGCAITLLPAGRHHPGLNAGPSFRLSRGAGVPTQSASARFVFRERLIELAAYCQFLRSASDAPAVLQGVRAALLGFAERLGP
jgi:hypothetical protein